MIAEVTLDQYRLNVEYSYESGDDYHCLDWIDLDVVSGMIELENYEEMLAMTEDEVYSCQRLFGNEIQRRLIEELRK